MIPGHGRGRATAISLVPYVAFAQLFAFEQSLGLAFAGQPEHSGTVNRVVQGVAIHPAR